MEKKRRLVAVLSLPPGVTWAPSSETAPSSTVRVVVEGQANPGEMSLDDLRDLNGTMSLMQKGELPLVR